MGAYKQNPNHLYIYIGFLAAIALGVTSAAGIFAALAHNNKENGKFGFFFVVKIIQWRLVQKSMEKRLTH